jgi:hypothetical protein
MGLLGHLHKNNRREQRTGRTGFASPQLADIADFTLPVQLLGHGSFCCYDFGLFRTKVPWTAADTTFVMSHPYEMGRIATGNDR